MTVTFRPSSLADFAALHGVFPAYRCRCETALLGDQVIAIAGLVYRPEGVFVSALLTDEMRRHPIALHRAVLRGLKAAAVRGDRAIYATSETDNPAAEPWLLRLGFKPAVASLYVWKPEEVVIDVA